VKLFGERYYKSDGLKLNTWKFFDNFVYPFKTFFTSIGRLFVWFPVIWKDRDWDYYSLYEVLKKKLELMSKFEKKESLNEKVEKITKQIDEAIYLINRLEDDYFEEALKPFYEVYPNFELEMEFLDDENNPQWKTLNFKYDNDEQRELYRKNLMNELKFREKDRKKLFKLISDNIDSWWS
jgi:hypothetical protein